MCTEELVSGWNEDFATSWNEALNEMKFSRQGTRAAPRFPRFHFSWNVAQVPAGPPVDRSGDMQQARDSEIILRDLGEEFSWSISQVVKETSESHRVCAASP